MGRVERDRRRMLTELYIYAGVALAGLISFLSPCVLPLVPPYLGYLGGTTIAHASADHVVTTDARRRIIIGSVFFVLGFTTVFVGLGAAASAFGQMIQAYKYEFGIAAGAVIILFGLHFLGILRIPLLYSHAQFHGGGAGSLAGAYLLGLAFAFGWTPCIGPVLSTVLTLAMSEQSLTSGVKLLFVYSLGLGVPFVLAAVAIGPFLRFASSFRRHLGMVEKLMGALLVVTGLLFMTGGINFAGQWLIEHVPILTRIEEWFTPRQLQDAIMKKGAQ
jgi:cytochrome c-type biogenesis protein